MLRLDEIHPVISGNKLFKLYYFMQKALQEKNGIVTFGGAYSNHLVATACLCKDAGLKCTGIVRGERPLSLSHTLIACIEYGMTLKFISRQEYDQKDEPDFLQKIKEEYKNYLVIPEGGYDPLGAAGAALIMSLVKKDASHICCAVGTATTLSGLSLALKNNQQLIGIPVLKNMHDLQQRMSFLTEQLFNPQQLQIIDNYHFGGYAKRTPELISFMNFFYQKHALPTDFVYTGKLMFGIIDSIKKDFFPKGSNIICIHTGGLQGNLSLPKGSLVF
ncbi:MAG: pyridoxal-phosphate dependent enzyme [Ferruginibacter sp.]